MKRKQFIHLAKWKKLEVLMTKGTILLHSFRHNLEMRLFSLNNFYVEVYNVKGTGEVMMINTFSDIFSLESWLQEVDISELVI